jgi:hypothetical protein
VIEFALGALVLIVGVVIVVAIVATRADRAARKRSQVTTAERRAAVWEVAEQGVRGPMATGGTGGVTRVFVRRMTAEGTEIDRIAVEDVPSNAADWEDLMLAARGNAARRAQILNDEP